MKNYPPTNPRPQVPIENSSQTVSYEYEDLPTQCWAEVQSGVYCSNIGKDRLGLCDIHAKEILPPT